MRFRGSTEFNIWSIFIIYNSSVSLNIWSGQTVHMHSIICSVYIECPSSYGHLYLTVQSRCNLEELFWAFHPPTQWLSAMMHDFLSFPYLTRAEGRQANGTFISKWIWSIKQSDDNTVQESSALASCSDIISFLFCIYLYQFYFVLFCLSFSLSSSLHLTDEGQGLRLHVE